MAIHSHTIAWKIPWTEESDRLQSMGSYANVHVSISFYLPSRVNGGVSQEACHPMNNSRGKQSSIPPLKTRPDSPVPL